MTVYSGKFILTETHLTDFKLTNMYMSVSYNISVRAVTTIGGNSDWSEIKTVITTSDSQTPYRITAEPILMTAEPERMKIRWMIPNWQGSPATNLIIERAIVGSCGLAIIDWDTNPHTIENIEILGFNYDAEGNALVLVDGKINFMCPKILRFIFFAGWHQLIED